MRPLVLGSGLLFWALWWCAQSAQAAPILGSAGGGLQSIGAPSENRTRFWDGNSWDSISAPDGAAYNPCNAGSLAIGRPCALSPTAPPALAGTSFTLPGADASYRVWGFGDGSADPNYLFLNQPGGRLFAFTMLGEITHDSAVDEIGWYKADEPQMRHTIFDGSDAAGATALVFIAGNFGVYYRNTASGAVFFTQAMFNTAGGKQQIAAFQLNGHTILGVEDVFSNVVSQSPQPGSSDYDYNDALVGFREATVPTVPVAEPHTVLLVATAISGFLLKRRRARR